MIKVHISAGKHRGPDPLQIEPSDSKAVSGSLTVGVVALALLVSACAPHTEPELVLGKHPVIIIDIDTLRADHLGCYGYRRETSPSIDALASESIVFDWAFSQAPNTPPSQATILSGLYPSTHGMIGDDDRLPHEVETLAEVLRENGYETAGFHDGGYLSNTFQMGQGFNTYESFGGRGLRAIGPEVISWLRNHAHENFFLFVHTYDTHTPYAPEPPFDVLFMEGVPEPTPGFIPNPEQMEAIRLSKYSGEPRQLPPNDLAYAMALYDGEIRFVDEWIRRFMAELRELELDEIATVVVVSDHGEEFQEHGSVLHEKLYRTVTHVPLMLRLPGARITRRIGEPVGLVDLMPTLLALSGVTIPEAVQGRNLAPTIFQEANPGRSPVFAESPFFGVRRSVVLGDLHLLFTVADQSAELYNYRRDPDELMDLARDGSQDTTLLLELLEDWQVKVDNEAIVHRKNDDPLDDRTEEQLRALGYIQ